MKQNFNYLIYEVVFPKKNNQEWKGLFKECASERLFFAVRFLNEKLLIF